MGYFWSQFVQSQHFVREVEAQVTKGQTKDQFKMLMESLEAYKKTYGIEKDGLSQLQ